MVVARGAARGRRRHAAESAVRTRQALSAIAALVAAACLSACTTTSDACDTCVAATGAIEAGAPTLPRPATRVSQETSTAADPRQQAEARAHAALGALPQAAFERGAEGASLADVKPFSVPASVPAKPSTLTDAILRALSNSPDIGLSLARYDEASAQVRVAQAPLYPQAEIALAGGHGIQGNYASGIGNYWDTGNAMGAVRGEAGFAARQLLFNFGATATDVERAVSTMGSQALQSVATAEDIAYGMAQAYLRVLQQRDLLKAADENVAALKEIARLVDENERNGNATLADVKRVRARVLDAQTGRADQDTELHLAMDRFRRLAKADPGSLRPPRTLGAAVPRSRDAALAEAYRVNPAVLSLQASIVAAKREMEAVKLGALPTLNLEASASQKHYAGNANKSELDVRAVAAMRYKLIDGGLNSAQIDQAAARVVQQEMKLQSEKEDLDTSLRQFYWQLESSRGKDGGLADAVASSRGARELYNAQFRDGKRSLLELLDVENAFYLSRRAQITNMYDEQQATYGIIKAIGRFVRTTVGNKA